MHVATVMEMTPGLRALLSLTTFNLFGKGLEFRASSLRGQNVLIKVSSVQQKKKVTPELMAVTMKNKEDRKSLLDLNFML